MPDALGRSSTQIPVTIMAEAFVCDAVRTPIGRFTGGLATVRPDDLGAIPLRTLIMRNPGVDWSRLDDLVLGCANQAGEDNRNVARMAALLAGLPVEVPGATIVHSVIRSPPVARWA